MKKVSVHEAKTHLSRLLRQVAAGDEVIIAKNGKPVARLVAVAVEERKAKRPMGFDRGRVWISDDFDQTPEEILADFEK